jgi:hypothetical protein
MTLALCYRAIRERNFHRSIEMSFFAWNMEMSFFGMPLAETWLARTKYNAKDAILIKNDKCYCSTSRLAIPSRSRDGQALYILDSCPENRDESKGNSIIKLWLQFIPIFGALHSQLRKGHTTKKDITMFLICIASPQKGMR